MTERIVKPLPFFVAVKEIALFYIHVFKHIIGLVALAALIQAIIALVTPENPTVGFALNLLGGLVSLFFYAWILYHADTILMNRSETIHDALQVAKKRFLPLIGAFVVYIFLILALFLFGFGMQYIGNLINLTIVFAIITLIVFAFIVTLFAFTLPALILDKMPIFKSFEYSVRIVWGNWWRTFGIFMIYVIPVFLLSLAILLLPTRDIYILAIFEFIYHIITYPLLIAVTLILYYDLKTRHQMVGFKHISEQPMPK